MAQDHERHTRHAIDRHGMRAELVVKLEVRAFAQQEEIIIGQDRRKPIGVLDIDLVIAVTRAHAVARRSIELALEQPDVMDALQAIVPALLVDDLHVLGVRQEDADQRYVALDMWPEIMERVGMPALDHGIGFGRELIHAGLASDRARMRQVPASGTRSQSGRCASSYSIS